MSTSPDHRSAAEEQLLKTIQFQAGRAHSSLANESAAALGELLRGLGVALDAVQKTTTHSYT